MTKEELEKLQKDNVKSFFFELGLISLLAVGFVFATIKEKSLNKKIEQTYKETKQIETAKQDSIINYQTQNQR